MHMDATPSTDACEGREADALALSPAMAADPPEMGPEDGQTTAEYALVLLGAAAIAAVLIKWATSSSGLTRLFTAVLRKLVQGVAG